MVAAQPQACGTTRFLRLNQNCRRGQLMATSWIKRSALLLYFGVKEPRRALGAVTALGLLVSLSLNARAAPDGVTSNVLVSLNETTFVNETSEFVTLLGHLHVQTN